MTGRLLALALAALPLTANSEEPLGRLFFTPEERQILDRQRQHPNESLAGTHSMLIINGVVARSTGKRTVWLNGAAHHDAQTPGGVVVTTGSEDPAAITLATDGKSAMKARVGATVGGLRAEASDVLGGGHLEVHKPTATTGRAPP